MTTLIIHFIYGVDYNIVKEIEYSGTTCNVILAVIVLILSSIRSVHLKLSYPSTHDEAIVKWTFPKVQVKNENLS